MIEKMQITQLINRDLQQVLDVSISAALRAGDFIKSVRASGNLELRYKGERDLLTAADLGAQEIIVTEIKKHFPNDNFFCEEADALPRTEDLLSPLWIIDPVDGTTNFATGHYQVGVSIAFAINGEVEVGVVNSPFLSELFSAVKGLGAKLNGNVITCPDESELSKTLVATGFPYQRHDLSLIGRRLTNVLSSCRDVRRLGAASLDICWVACGRLQAYYETVETWDMAAASLIAKEAGAKVGHINQESLSGELPADFNAKDLIVSTPGVFEKVRQLLNV